MKLNDENILNYIFTWMFSLDACFQCVRVYIEPFVSKHLVTAQIKTYVTTKINDWLCFWASFSG